MLCGFGKCKCCNDEGEKHGVVVLIPEPEGEHLDGVSFVVVVAGKRFFIGRLVDVIFGVDDLDDEVVDFAVAVVGSPVLFVVLVGLVEADDGGVERVC